LAGKVNIKLYDFIRTWVISLRLVRRGGGEERKRRKRIEREINKREG
jgi:hypothetical protein